ncbi:hypothetical protein [Deinococcus sp.]|uniref:hypothetical protein n=1 Tax=Deinococcus sp. TaxID=47478 RepID=UPI0025E48085|nr:hypothetical protein [Deinococcus sp.]
MLLSPLALAAGTTPTRYGEVVFWRGEVGTQAFVTGRAAFGRVAPGAAKPALGQCELSSGPLVSPEIDAEAFGQEAGMQGQEAPISAGASLSVLDGARTVLTLDPSGPGYQLEGGPSELLRRVGGVAGPLPGGAVLKVPGQSGDFGFPALSVPVPQAPLFVWQTTGPVTPSQVLRWSGASRVTAAQVKVLLRQGEGERARNVICTAPDTGSFALPEAVRRELSGPLKVIGAFRTVQTVIRKGDAELRVVLEEGGLLE